MFGFERNKKHVHLRPCPLGQSLFVQRGSSASARFPESAQKDHIWKINVGLQSACLGRVPSRSFSVGAKRGLPCLRRKKRKELWSALDSFSNRIFCAARRFCACMYTTPTTFCHKDGSIASTEQKNNADAILSPNSSCHEQFKVIFSGSCPHKDTDCRNKSHGNGGNSSFPEYQVL